MSLRARACKVFRPRPRAAPSARLARPGTLPEPPARALAREAERAFLRADTDPGPVLPDSVVSAPRDTAEARLLMQARLAQFGRIGMVIGCVFLTAAIAIFVTFHPSGGPAAIAAQAAILLVSALVWGLTRHRIRSLRMLSSLDVVATLAQCAIFVLLGWGLPIWARPEVLQVIAVTDVLALRAFLIPSTTARTVALGGLAATAIVVSTGLRYAGHRPHPDAPSAASYTSIAALLGLATVIVTGLTSRTIFGLRARVREAAQLGQYTLLEKIGEGGMGIVYRARHAMLRRPTAVKLLPANRAGEHNLARFEREVQLTSLLTHPNTVSIYDYGRTSDGVLYYAMEYLPGVDLETLVQLDGPQPPGRVIHLLRQLCGALAEAHEIGLIHRDVKPANILLLGRGGDPDFVKVLDFGLVKCIDGPADAAATAVNQIVGTPLYLSPEAIVAPDQVEARSDLYAAGALGYFLITGRTPFTGGTSIEICGHHLHSRPRPPSERLGRPVPADLEAILLQCLEKSPGARPTSAKSLAAALGKCSDAATWTPEDAAAWWRGREGVLAERRARGASRRAGGDPGSGRATEEAPSAREISLGIDRDQRS